MVRLTSVVTRSYRNLADATVTFPDEVTVVYGHNGQGKSNLLESIYLLGNLRSFRPCRNGDLIRFGEGSASVTGTFSHEEIIEELSVIVDEVSRKPLVDGKPPERVGTYLAKIPMVLFSPDDIRIVRGEPELRRRFVDRSIFLSDPGYLQEYRLYQRSLEHRNRLLRNGETTTLDAWNRELAVRGIVLTQRRTRQIATLQPLVEKGYRMISGTDGTLTLSYRSSVRIASNDADSNEPVERFLAQLEMVQREEALRQTTLVGPHRDDVVFLLDGKEVRRYASQGEQRTVALALRVAETLLLEHSRGYPPLLLLDDLSSELDRGRIRRIMEYLFSGTMQIVMTATSPEVVTGTDGRTVGFIRMESGRIIRHG